MTDYKYSIVIPTRNGFSTLKHNLPDLLKIAEKRGDVQIVISDNNSTDALPNWVRRYSNIPFFTFCQTKMDKKIGESLNFAISHASGEYISYMGDDDQITESRFETLDDLLSEYNDLDVIIGEIIRCEIDLENVVKSISFSEFNGKVVVLDEMTKISYLNKVSINAGGSFVIKNKIYDKIKKEFGFYSTQQGVEFFILRAALLLSNFAIYINKPILLMGRTSFSVGNIAFNNISEKAELYRWNDTFEYNESIDHSLMFYKGYVPISNDSAIYVSKAFKLENNVNFYIWIRSFVADIINLVNKNKMDRKDGFRIVIQSKFSFWYKIYGFIYFLYLFVKYYILRIKAQSRHSNNLTFNYSLTVSELMKPQTFNSLIKS